MTFSHLFFALFYFQSFGSMALPVDAGNPFSNKKDIMTNTTPPSDSTVLSALNAQFIRNFIRQDAEAHARIIHPDFVCIESNGSIVSREVYLKNWATDYETSGCTAFSYADEQIRIFGNIALVRSKTTATILRDGQLLTGHTIYTDTYLKENGEWTCIQVQITPIK